MAFTAPVDIAKRALQHLGQPTITALSDSSQQAVQSSIVYPAVRTAELRRSPWWFAASRAVMRARTATTFQITFLAWAVGTTYAVGDVVSDSLGYLWISNRATNLAITPGVTDTTPYWIPYHGPVVADLWASGKFFAGDVVYKTGSPNKAYIAIPPRGTLVTTQDPASGAPWHEIAGATVATMFDLEPIGVSLLPSALATSATQRNIYDLPANYMRIAPQDPKFPASASRAFLTAGQQFNDFEIEGGFLYSADTGPKIFRFTGDFTNVRAMEALFCELVALGMAKEMCMILTGNRELLAQIDRQYDQRASDARSTSLIEMGSAELEQTPQPQQPQDRSRGA